MGLVFLFTLTNSVFCLFMLRWVFVAAFKLSLVAARRLLIAVASLVAEHGLEGAWASVVAACRLSSCGGWA